ncbi:MAG: hypothetical protein LBK82_12355 [Planctomycetaceae bacterium]|nr:hypothetical protein [Planctomycetaceae bacterium]
MQYKVTEREGLYLKQIRCYETALSELSVLVTVVAESYDSFHGDDENILFRERIGELSELTSYFLNDCFHERIEYGVLELLLKSQKRMQEYELSTGILGDSDVTSRVFDFREIMKKLREERYEVQQ